jgi:cytochrome c5
VARRFVIGAVAIALAAASGARASAGNRSTANPAFSPEIQTILQTHCTMCHSAGGPSPMPLVSYDDVLPWARSIKEQTLTRRMPKWSAARGYGAFANDPTLTPYELSLITAWVDAGSPPGPERTAPAAPRQVRLGLAIDAGAATATIRTRSGWITGWDFRPGDPLITSVTFTSSDGAAIGTWVAGDRTVRLPRGSAIRVVPPVRVEIRRREKTAYEAAFTPLKSTLRLIWTAAESQRPHSEVVRRVWSERVACGGALGPAESSVLAVRPLLESGAAAQITLERLGGAQPTLLGWFRDFDPGYARIYWLRQPLDFTAGARVSGDGPCQLDVILSARR